MNIDTTYQTALSEALQRGVSVQKIKDLGRRLCEAEQRSEWLAEMREQYETEHPEFRQGTESDWYKLHEEDGRKWSDLTDEEKENFRIKNDRPSFDEWISETKEVTKTRTVTDENGEEKEEEYTEEVPVRQFTPDEEKCNDEISELLKQARFRRLEKIFCEKTTGLKKIAIDKPWMTDPEAISQQYRVYEEVYKNAKAGYYDETTNKAIITANEATKKALAPVTLLLNNVRSVLQGMIEAGHPEVDAKLDFAGRISLERDDLTPEKLGEIAAYFGGAK